MLNFFQRRNIEDTIPFDAALKRLLLYHEACMLFITNLRYQDEAKADLAIHLYFLGAVDCSSQLHRLSDKQFTDLATAFFRAIKTNKNYTTLLLRFFLKITSVPAAMECVIEGGQHFNKWLNGNSDIPICSIGTIKEFCGDPNIPNSVGHLCI